MALRTALLFLIFSVASSSWAGQLTLNDTEMRSGENIGSFYFSGLFHESSATNCDVRIHIALKSSHLAKRVLSNTKANNQNAPLVLRLTDLSFAEIDATFGDTNDYGFNFTNIKRKPRGTNKLYARAHFICDSNGERKRFFSQIASFDFTAGANLGPAVNISKLAAHIRSRYQP